jgi:hypothetical protein
LPVPGAPYEERVDADRPGGGGARQGRAQPCGVGGQMREGIQTPGTGGCRLDQECKQRLAVPRRGIEHLAQEALRGR